VGVDGLIHEKRDLKFQIERTQIRGLHAFFPLVDPTIKAYTVVYRTIFFHAGINKVSWFLQKTKH
jgi:hypothetical protein